MQRRPGVRRCEAGQWAVKRGGGGDERMLAVLSNRTPYAQDVLPDASVLPCCFIAACKPETTLPRPGQSKARVSGAGRVGEVLGWLATDDELRNFVVDVHCVNSNSDQLITCKRAPWHGLLFLLFQQLQSGALSVTARSHDLRGAADHFGPVRIGLTAQQVLRSGGGGGVISPSHANEKGIEACNSSHHTSPPTNGIINKPRSMHG